MMEQVLQNLKKTITKRQIAVVRLEIDYELAALHDAMKGNDPYGVVQTKERLKQLRQELIRLEE